MPGVKIGTTVGFLIAAYTNPLPFLRIHRRPKQQCALIVGIAAVSPIRNFDLVLGGVDDEILIG